MQCGFNRYMVECESAEFNRTMLAEEVLIDTWWNVNTKLFTTSLSRGWSFNRYMVECEYESATFI